MFSHKKKKPVAIVRIHVESEAGNTGSTTNVYVLRSEPVVVNVSKDPILTEADLISARTLETPDGGFSLELRFEQTASWRLEQFTAVNPGKHLAIYGHWGEKPEDGRWLAAPLIARRNATGVVAFTPDASHEEIEQMVQGLNEAIKKKVDSEAKKG